MTALRVSTAAVVLACSVAGFAPVAGAEPVPPVPVPSPAPPPPAPSAPPTGLLPSIGSVLAQSDGGPAGPLGLPNTGLGPELVLGQNTVPAAPGQPIPVDIPNLNAFNPDMLLPLNLEPAVPGEGQAAPGIGPSPDDPGTGRLAFLGRIYDMYQAGLLKGALLGQVPQDAAGQPVLPPSEPDPVG